MLDPDFPRNVLEFEKTFSDEDACLAYVRRKKWPDGFRCPRCNHRSSHVLRTRRVEQCASCRHQTSITAGTMFHKSRKPLSLWFRAILEFVSRKHGCNAMDLQRLLGLNRQTAWTWLHKIRDGMVSPGIAPLQGDVEVDETHLGGSEEGVFGRDRGTKKQLLVGAVERNGRGCGRARLAPVATASSEDLQTWISENVAVGALIHSDGLASYEGLDATYTHDPEVIGDPRQASVKFPHVHRIFSLFKRVILGTYHGSVSAKYLAAYANEFIFRFNRRNSKCRTLLLQRVLENAMHQAPRIHLFAGRGGMSPITRAG